MPSPKELPPPVWHLHLLDRPSLVAQVGPTKIALRPKDAALLALIALSGTFNAEHLAALLWPKATSKQADTSLRQRLFRLRREACTPLVSSCSLLQLTPEVALDLAAALERLRDDERADAGDLLGDHAFADLPELAEWLRSERRKWHAQRSDVGC